MTYIPQEYKRDVRGCERLWSSISTYLRGIGLYGSNYDGDLENSFSTLYKAWDQLWQADRTSSYKNPNGEFLKKGEYIFGLTDYMNAVEENVLKGEFFHQYLYYSLDNSTNPKEYQDGLAKDEYSSIQDDPFKGYDYRLAVPFFIKIHHKRHPAILNLQLLKTIRNYDQHDRIEESTKSNSILVSAMNPYITANAFNYHSAYVDIYQKVKKDCSLNCRSRPKCHSKFLPDPSKLIMDIQIPTSLPYAQLISGDFSGKLNNGANPTKNKEPNSRALAERTALGWKIFDAIKKHDTLYQPEKSEPMLFTAILNTNTFGAPLDKASYKAFYKAPKNPQEITLDKMKKKISLELYNELCSIVNDSKFPYIVKIYERNDSPVFDEINTNFLQAAIKAYGYGSLLQVVNDLNENPDFPFVTDIHTVKNALTNLEENDFQEFLTMKMNFFGEDRYHVKIIRYLKKYADESEYLKICTKPEYK